MCQQRLAYIQYSRYVYETPNLSPFCVADSPNLAKSCSLAILAVQYSLKQAFAGLTERMAALGRLIAHSHELREQAVGLLKRTDAEASTGGGRPICVCVVDKENLYSKLSTGTLPPGIAPADNSLLPCLDADGPLGAAISSCLEPLGVRLSRPGPFRVGTTVPFGATGEPRQVIYVHQLLLSGSLQEGPRTHA
eukprot:COSAG01_NODE_9372_length_2464_cov_5.895560_4_plen_193_part_00